VQGKSTFRTAGSANAWKMASVAVPLPSGCSGNCNQPKRRTTDNPSKPGTQATSAHCDPNRQRVEAVHCARLNDLLHGDGRFMQSIAASFSRKTAPMEGASSSNVCGSAPATIRRSSAFTASHSLGRAAILLPRDRSAPFQLLYIAETGRADRSRERPGRQQVVLPIELIEL
jgi:hypothetical protein